jgi:hypothetical protein
MSSRRMNVSVLIIWLVREDPQLLWIVGPDHEYVACITESTEGIIGCSIKCHLLQVSREEIGNHKRRRLTHKHSVNLFGEWSPKQKN